MEFGHGALLTVGTLPELTISMYTNISDISQIWLKFQTHAATTLYHTFQWCNAWQKAVGEKSGCRPQILVGRTTAGVVKFILPLQMRTSFGLKILEWHGYPNVNYGYGLFDRIFLRFAEPWFAEHFDTILNAIGPFDVLSLQDMPLRLHNSVNPLAKHTNIKAANRAYAINLQPDYNELYAAKRSSATRKSQRKKDARLIAMGEVEFGVPTSKDEAHHVLDEMFDDQSQRLAKSGIHDIFNESEKRFFHLLIEETDKASPFLIPYVLKCNGVTLAAMLGGCASNTFWPFITSMKMDETQKHSPGDYLLRHVIEASCRLGLESFDFASGESTYKSQWSDDIIDLGITLKARNIWALIWVCGLASKLYAKRLIKQNPVALSCVCMLRRLLAGH